MEEKKRKKKALQFMKQCEIKIHYFTFVQWQSFLYHSALGCGCGCGCSCDCGSGCGGICACASGSDCGCSCGSSFTSYALSFSFSLGLRGRVISVRKMEELFFFGFSCVRREGMPLARFGSE